MGVDCVIALAAAKNFVVSSIQGQSIMHRRLWSVGGHLSHLVNWVRLAHLYVECYHFHDSPRFLQQPNVSLPL